MKTLLTLFVLLFSSSLVAGEDLTGKKLFCFKKNTNANSFVLFGLNFIDHSKVKILTETYEKPHKEYLYNYATSVSKIVIDGTYIGDNYTIDRKNLDVEPGFLNSDFLFKGDQCKVALKDLSELFKEKLLEFEQKVLL